MQGKTAKLALALALGALAASPVAMARSADDGTTFEGSCRFSGELRQNPPLTTLPQAGEGVAEAQGTCSGALTDDAGHARRLDAERATYVATAQGTLSCGGGSATGSGVLRLAGKRLHFRFSEVRGPAVAAIRLDGAGGGSAAGEARASTEEDPLAIAAQCAGDGLRQVSIDIDIATAPSITG